MPTANPLLDIKAENKPPHCAQILEEMTNLSTNFVKRVTDYGCAQFKVFQVDDGEVIPVDSQVFQSMEEAVSFIEKIKTHSVYDFFTVLPVWRSRWKPDNTAISGMAYKIKPVQYSITYTLGGELSLFPVMAYSDTHALEIAPALIADAIKCNMSDVTITSLIRY